MEQQTTKKAEREKAFQKIGKKVALANGCFGSRKGPGPKPQSAHGGRKGPKTFEMWAGQGRSDSGQERSVACYPSKKRRTPNAQKEEGGKKIRCQ